MSPARVPLYRPWTSSDDEELRRLASVGATVLRATAALNRRSQTVRKRAGDLGLKLVGMREAKRRVRLLAEEELRNN
jgi:hypothetical protein